MIFICIVRIQIILDWVYDYTYSEEVKAFVNHLS